MRSTLKWLLLSSAVALSQVAMTAHEQFAVSNLSVQSLDLGNPAAPALSPAAARVPTAATAQVTAVCEADQTPEACCSTDQQLIQLTLTDDTEDLSAGGARFCVLALDGDDELELGVAGDTVIGGDGQDEIELGHGNDVGLGSPGDDRIHGNRGGDALYGGEGDDQLYGNNDPDFLVGGSGSDTLRGHNAADHLWGGEGADLLDGGAGDDLLSGGAGDDELRGGPGDDVLVGGPGRDHLDGGPGDDRIRLRAVCEMEEGETIDGGPGTDTLESLLSREDLIASGIFVRDIEIVDVVEPAASDCSTRRDGRVICSCCTESTRDPRFRCETCAEGFRADSPFDPATDDVEDFEDAEPDTSSTACVPALTCADLDCGDHGTCRESSSGATCQCDLPFFGSDCASCPPGMERSGDDCISRQTCSESYCHGHGTCATSPIGTVECTCDDGFEGPNCGMPDLEISADPDSIAVGSIRMMQAVFANGESCEGPLEWSVVEGEGEVEAEGDGVSAVFTAPELVREGLEIDAAVVRVECVTARGGRLQSHHTVCYTGDPDFPVTGACKRNMLSIDNAMIEHMKAAELVGGTLAVTKDDNLVYLRGYGWQEREEVNAMRTCTPMRIASLSKPITRAAARMMDLDNETVVGTSTTFDTKLAILPTFRELVGISEGDPGPVCETCAAGYYVAPESDYEGWESTRSEDEDLESYAPFGTGLPDPAWWDLRVEHLMHIASGLPTNSPTRGDYQHPVFGDPNGSKLLKVANDLDLPDRPPGPPLPEELLRWLSGVAFLERPPADVDETRVKGPLYSNVAYVLLGEIISVSKYGETGRLFDYLVEQVFPRTGDNNAGFRPGVDGVLDIGKDPTLSRNVIYPGRTLPADLEEAEPNYLTDAHLERRPTIRLMFKAEDGRWVRGGPELSQSYADFSVENKIGSGDLVSTAATLARFFNGYNLPGDPRKTNDIPPNGFHQRASGAFDGTFGLYMFWSDYPAMALQRAKTPTSGTLYKDLPLRAANPPTGVRMIALFNERNPGSRDGRDDYDDGTQHPYLLIDRLQFAIGREPLFEDGEWPAPLTEAELAWGCDPYVAPPPPEECGNGVVDAEGEECDGSDLGGKTCEDVGPFDGGTLSCNTDCRFVKTQCDNSGCGNGRLDPGEQCDPGTHAETITTGNPRSEQFCDPNTCLWIDCVDSLDFGREGCPCTRTGHESEGDRCPGISDDDGMDLICSFGPSHQAIPGGPNGIDPGDDGKRCMRCPYFDGNYGVGSGCPCGPGGSCVPWAPTEGGGQVEACTRNVMVCRASAGDLIGGEFDETSRCWDVIDEFLYSRPCENAPCLDATQECLYGQCEETACVDAEGIPGICLAMGMVCSLNPYGDGSPYCINRDLCDIPVSTSNGASSCGRDTTKNIINGTMGISGEQMCPQPYRY